MSDSITTSTNFDEYGSPVYKSKSSEDDTTAEDEEEHNTSHKKLSSSCLGIRTDVTGFPSNKKLKCDRYRRIRDLSENKKL